MKNRSADFALKSQVRLAANKRFLRPTNLPYFPRTLTQMEAKPTGKATFRPKDLELFHASKFQQWSTFRGYDKATVNPAHGELPRWNVKQSTIVKLGGYGTQYDTLN
jgi:hypothetical protein